MLTSLSFWSIIGLRLEVLTMVFITGDTHGNPQKIIDFSHRMELSKKDTIIILGDVGANYFIDERDAAMKKHLNNLDVNILCVHGNHEIRPSNLSSYKLVSWKDGYVWIEEEYPNLKFAKDGEIYSIEEYKYIVIGGAYSVDKEYRIARGFGWWEDEQPSADIKKYVEKQLTNKKYDIILSHTCPYKYEPIEEFLPFIDQSSVDTTTEVWLDKIEENFSYKFWLCGHWHTDKQVDNIYFLFNNWLSSESLKKKGEYDGTE